MKPANEILDQHLVAHDGDSHWSSNIKGATCYTCACEAIKTAQLQGLEEGLRMYAHWKDGVEYVGTCGRTLAKALEDIRKEYE